MNKCVACVSTHLMDAGGKWAELAVVKALYEVTLQFILEEGGLSQACVVY